MTNELSFDRLARAWLEQGPDEAPDRVVAAVLLAVETTPQVRRPIRWLPWRSITMTRLRMGAAVAVVLIAALGGAYLLTRNGDVGPPTATPVVTPSVPPASPEGIPAALIGQWLGGPKTGLPGLLSSSGTVLTFTDHSLALAQANLMNVALLEADAGASDAGRFVVSGDVPCTPNTPGIYTWQLSASARHLTVGRVSDDCATRSAAIPGDYDKSACTSTEFVCLGPLGDRTYSSQYLDPRIKPGSPWAPNYGAITYTVPAGWTNLEDYPGNLILEASLSGLGPAFGAGFTVGLWAHPAAADPSVNCFVPKPGGPLTVDGLIGHLQATPALTTTNLRDVTIAGHTGKSVDIAVAASWTGTCPGANGAINVLVQSGSDSTWVFGLGPGARDRVILLDLGAGDVLGISLESGDGAKFEAFMTEATPVVDSLTFE